MLWKGITKFKVDRYFRPQHLLAITVTHLVHLGPELAGEQDVALHLLQGVCAVHAGLAATVEVHDAPSNGVVCNLQMEGTGEREAAYLGWSEKRCLES